MVLSTSLQNSHWTAQSEPSEVTDYRAGFPLEPAMWKFAPLRLQKQWKKIQRAQNQWADEYHERMKTAAKPDSIGALFEDISKKFGLPWLNFSKQTADTEAEMWKCLCARVQDGELVAMGYEMPRKAGDLPVRIPPDVFGTPTLDWAKSTVTGAGMNFVSVRVASAEDLIPSGEPTITQVSCSETPIFPINIPPRRGKGRPGYYKKVVDARKALMATGCINDSTDLSITVEKIIIYLLANNLVENPSKPPHPKAIEKHLQEISIS